MRLWLGLAALIAACGGAGGGQGLGGIDRAPSGLDMWIDLAPVADGTALPAWTGVPVDQVRWTSDLGGSVSSNYAHAQIDYTVTATMGDVGAVFVPEIEGDVDAFYVEALGLIGGGGRIDVYCLPPAPGVYEAELRAQIEGYTGWAELRLRCEATTDTAMFLQTLEQGFGETNQAILLRDGVRYDLIAQQRMAGPGSGVVIPPSYLGTLADDGVTGIRAMFDASGDPFGFYTWDALDGSLTPLLTEAEAAEHLDWMGAHNAALSADGQMAALSSYRSGVFLKDRSTGAILPVPEAGQGAWGLEIFGVTASGGEAFYGRALPQVGHLNRDALWAVDTATGQVSPAIGPNAAATIGELDWVNQFAFDSEGQRVVVGSSYFGAFEGYVVDRAADTARPVLEGIYAHADAREGNAATNPVVTMTSLSRSGRYLAAVLNRWEDAYDWAGTHFVFVEDLETGELFSVGWLPDGTALSGDGWTMREAVVTDDGSAVAFNATWTGGLGGGLVEFAIVVPRRAWVPVER
jgi:hypothetical protein